MRSLTSILLAIACIAGCACTGGHDAETPATQTTPIPQNAQFTVATWNVHNLFDTECDSGACGSGNYEPDMPGGRYTDKLREVVAGIKSIHADVILLQEIEKESGLEDIRTALGAETYPGAAFGETGRDASVDVAILTRGHITQVHRYRDLYWITQTDGTQKRLARELLAAEIALPDGTEITAFTTHFVSKATDSVGDRRLGEAELTQRIIAEYIAAHPGRPVVFGGDLNDTPGSAPIEAVGRDGILRSVTEGMPAALITTWNDEVTFDHIFYSPAAAPLFERAEVLCDSIRSGGFSSSDHCAVRAFFKR